MLIAAVSGIAVAAGCVQIPSSPALIGQQASGNARVDTVKNANHVYVLTESSSAAYSVNVYAKERNIRITPVGPIEENALPGFTVDSESRLYAVDAEQHRSASLGIFAKKGQRIRTLTQQSPFTGLVVDALADLYTTCGAHRVCEYKPGRQTLIRTFPKSSPPIASDASDDVAMTSGRTIDVYAAHGTIPYWKIRTNAVSLIQLAFDSYGDLYALDYGAGQSGTVSVYPPGSSNPRQTIVEGVHQPTSMALDGEGNLFVLNRPASGASVTVYAYGTSTPARTITRGIVGSGIIAAGAPPAIAVDFDGTLYVANQGSPGNVKVYRPNATSPLRTIEANLYDPLAVAL